MTAEKASENLNCVCLNNGALYLHMAISTSSRSTVQNAPQIVVVFFDAKRNNDTSTFRMVCVSVGVYGSVTSFWILEVIGNEIEMRMYSPIKSEVLLKRTAGVKEGKKKTRNASILTIMSNLGSDNAFLVKYCSLWMDYIRWVCLYYELKFGWTYNIMREKKALEKKLTLGV